MMRLTAAFAPGLLFLGWIQANAAPPGLHPVPPARAGLAPERSALFISPMGEPFRPEGNGEGLAIWFAGADADRDGALTVAELARDAARYFAALDTDGDGEIA